MKRTDFLDLMKLYSELCDERGLIRNREQAARVTVQNADGSIVGFPLAYRLEYVSPKRTFAGKKPDGPIMHTAILRSPLNSVFGEQYVPLSEVQSLKKDK